MQKSMVLECPPQATCSGLVVCQWIQCDQPLLPRRGGGGGGGCPQPPHMCCCCPLPGLGSTSCYITFCFMALHKFFRQGFKAIQGAKWLGETRHGESGILHTDRSRLNIRYLSWPGGVIFLSSICTGYACRHCDGTARKPQPSDDCIFKQS